MRLIYALCISMLLSVCVIGCGGGADPEATSSDEPAAASNAELKERLEYIAGSGEAGSALAGLQEPIDASGDESLKADFTKLQSETNPAKVKAIAKQMAAKL
jgi:hypothetical protein